MFYVGYEIIGVALFGVTYLWLTTQRLKKDDGTDQFILPQGWRFIMFGWGWLHAIYMLALAAAPNAIILKGVGILAYSLVFILIAVMHAFTMVADLWASTR